MLEKIGLPPKPSLRGNNWVVDASHCQGCSSQFTFINRKHHCRRCGGLFCNSCTQQRMALRGQGDSPVRICEPCKALEEAARFEMRYGHKNRAAKGAFKLTSKKEDEAFNQVLAIDNTTQKTAYSASCSNIQEIVSQVEGNIVRNLSLEQPARSFSDVGTATPEDLRHQALVEKNKYRTLKAEGKSEEALRAFKRGKELERQAGALELSIRKNRKKALSSSNMDDIQQNKDDFKAPIEKNKSSTRNSKEKDDLSSELKELGWSDLDLRDTDKKPVALTLEGELSSLTREVTQKPHQENQALSVEKSQVIVHKKKALELKRAGNLVEAKEELKKAKVLERKIEEEELLGPADDSDDELSSLMRGMTADENDDFSARFKPDVNFDLDQFVVLSDDLGVDGNFEVTDEDMDDPDMASALKSLGWTDDTNSGDFLGENVIYNSNRESLVIEVQSLKREAVIQKRTGNTAEAMILLKKAKVLEKELEGSDAHRSFIVNQGSISQSAGEPFFSASETVKNVNSTNNTGRSKLVIQKELISLKKNALSLRREGRFDESVEELKRAKVLEEQLEDLNKTPSITRPSTGNRQIPDKGNMSSGDEDEEEVTDQDMNDPSYISLLKNLGLDDEDNAKVPSNTSKEKDKGSKYRSESSIIESTSNDEAKKPRKSKSEIQRELLTLKRKALNLRRQGETKEADEVLKMEKSLEAQLQAFEKPTQPEVSCGTNEGSASVVALQTTVFPLWDDQHENKIGNSRNQENVGLDKPDEILHANDEPFTNELTSSQAADTHPHFSSLQTEILAHKRKAVTLKREGKLAEAKEELRKAKFLEKRVEEETSHTSTNSSKPSITEVSSSDKKEANTSSALKPLSSRERFKLQQESLNHKRQALKLRREGKIAEADAELELAKALESQLQDSESLDSSKSSEPVDDVTVENFLDPQLLSALRSLGLEDAHRDADIPEPPKSNVNNSNSERDQLMELWKAEKVKAVNLKRLGNQAEALEALRRAKLYEKKLQSLTSR